jgi:hypothetical protein
MNTTIVIYAVLIALTAGGLLVVTTGGFSGIGVAEGALSSSRSYGDPDQIGDPNSYGDPNERTFSR